MIDDLISRSELRKKFQAILDRGDMFCEYDIIGMVDNAPTVPNEYMRGYEAAERECKRPQGIWLKGREISRTMLGDEVLHIEYKDYTCSNCGLVLDNLLYHLDGSPFYKFCPNCGADMRGGTR